MLSIVYYPETKVDFHTPESCLGGRGIEIKKSVKSITVMSGGQEVKIDLNQLIWQGEGKQRMVYYFYKAGQFLGQSYIKLRVNLALNKFRNTEKSGSLIRISTAIPSLNIQEASDNLCDFIVVLYPFLIEYL